MEIERFNFNLPPELIAQVPAERREESRMMVVDRARGTVEHCRFSEFPERIPSGCRLFRNNAAVLKARLRGRRVSGGPFECLLERPVAGGDGLEWFCMLKPGKKLMQDRIFGEAGVFRAEVCEKTEGGTYRVRFMIEGGRGVDWLLETLGELPLPPYIGREAKDERRRIDEERYQTVYADPGKRVAAAAPTAGLHFTPEILRRVEAGGGRFFDLTLHVGLGTFQPIKVTDVTAHAIHRELYELPTATFLEIANAAGGGPRLAVGTTSVRTMEDAVRRFPGGPPPTGRIVAEANIYLYPPASFLAVDALLTNFHLPKSTLLCLVAAFLAPGHPDAGIDRLQEIYGLAVREKYRFFSYGDCMLIL